MVKITNGTVTAEVTQGAYDLLYYKEQGFVIVSDENEKWEEEENG